MSGSENRQLVALLHQVVSAAVPKASTVQKYGGTLFTQHPDEKHGLFCGIFSYKAHVQLSFALGAQLDDPDGLLEGNGKFRRHLNFRSLDDVDVESVQRLLKSAAQLQESVRRSS
jgi:hypothetical protein